jgi:hypothetical protein
VVPQSLRMQSRKIARLAPCGTSSLFQADDGVNGWAGSQD